MALVHIKWLALALVVVAVWAGLLAWLSRGPGTGHHGEDES